MPDKPAEIVRQKVESSQIESIGYDPENKTLEVEFKSGGTVYQYYSVDSATYEEMLASESKGKFLSQKIKGNFAYMKVKDREVKNVERRDIDALENQNK